MKKLLLSLLFAAVCGSLSAQNSDRITPLDCGLVRQKHKSELSVGVGALPSHTLIYPIAYASINVSYSSEVARNFYVGGTLSLSYTDPISWFVPMVYTKYDWLNLEHFALYSRIGLGLNLLYMHGVESMDYIRGFGVLFACQISPIGIEAGDDRLRFYAEFGAGNAGYIETGIRFRF